jgi:hypothetical protein
MRGVLLVAAGCVCSLSGCSSGGSGGSGASDAGDAGVTCPAGTLALGGPPGPTPHGIYLLGNASLTSTGFSATLPAGGSVLLEWSGDATSGPVPVDGTLVVPLEGTTQSWCISSASTLRVSGTHGTLQLQLATGAVVEPDGTCKQIEDGGAQLPVSTEAAEGCFALGS